MFINYFSLYNIPSKNSSYTIKSPKSSGDSNLEGFGGWNNDGSGSGGEGFGNYSHFVFYFLLLAFSIWLYKFAISGIKKTLKKFNQYLNRLVQKNPRNRLIRLYSVFLKTFAVFIALAHQPRSFCLDTSHALACGRIQTLLKILSFFFVRYLILKNSE
uniref:Uncharacterized protein n=1 Tax=Pseudochlorodesmis sp. HV01306a TaxID=2358488 RepID=A0A386AY11_9CHLO|nr:hypothetical protein [Pseudochlorodesmis sp. HV01306a]